MKFTDYWDSAGHVSQVPVIPFKSATSILFLLFYTNNFPRLHAAALAGRTGFDKPFLAPMADHCPGTQHDVRTMWP